MNNDLHWVYTTYEAEGDDYWYFVFNSEIPYCMHWPTVRQIFSGNESDALLGYQRWAVQNLVGESSVQPVLEDPEGVDAGNW